MTAFCRIHGFKQLLGMPTFHISVSFYSILTIQLITNIPRKAADDVPSTLDPATHVRNQDEKSQDPGCSQA